MESESNGLARQETVYQVYLSVINGYGNHARFIPKKHLYEETAERTNYSAEHVRKIISKRLKHAQ
jgi:hypothetical protein